MTVTTISTDEPIARGITRLRIQPGGAAGPGRCVIDSEDIGGGMWNEAWNIGSPSDPWFMFNTEVRMAPNQYFPAHWHGSWIAVIVWDGSIMIGDWLMKPGDILISPANAEYGPLLNGPHGSQIFEVFASNIGYEAVYAPEYHDHPMIAAFYKDSPEPPIVHERYPGSAQNKGNQTTPLKGIPGMLTGHFDGTGRWDLGDANDPSRGVIFETKLSAAESRPSHSYRDWHAFMVWDGDLAIGNHELKKDDILVVEPNSQVPALQAGHGGAHLVEMARTIAGEQPQ
jgi:hypothetical protein